MSISISQIEDTESQLVDLVSRLSPCRARDECNAALYELRKIKAVIARNPDISRIKAEN